MVADDVAARKLFEKDHQADAMLKEFPKGTPVREGFEMFKSAVSPVANAWARLTHTYNNDPILHQFMHTTFNQVNSKWNCIHTKLDSFITDLIVGRLAKLVGGWVGNTVIDVFA
jgi:hypothetical protein